MGKLLFVLILVCYAKYGFAQVDSILEKTHKTKKTSSPRLLIKAYGGYGFMSPGSYRIQSTNFLTYRDALNIPHDTTFHTQGRKGIGGGWRYGAGIGYIVNDFWSVGIDFEFQKSQKLTNALGTKLRDYEYDSTADEMHYKAMTFTPYITFKAVSRPDYFLYNRIGIVFTLPFTLHTTGNSTSLRSDYWPPGPADSFFAYHWLIEKSHSDDYKLSLGVGFNLAFGINYRLTNHIRVFAELFGNFTALHPERSVIKTVTSQTYSSYSAEYDFNVIPAQVIRYNPYYNLGVFHESTNTKYQNGGDVERNEESYNWTPGLPDVYATYTARDQRFHINMNSIGLNLGIQLRL